MCFEKCISDDVAKGYTLGPFDRPPLPDFVCNSLGVVSKKNGGHRVIMDLSQPFGDSVNDFMSLDGITLEFCSVDGAAKLLQQAGKGALMGKQDIESAFGLIPVRKDDWHRLGFQLDGKFYFDVVLPFGCRSSPFLFCHFSDGIRWIVVHRSGLLTILHYVGDFFSVGRPQTGECQQLMSSMTDT